MRKLRRCRQRSSVLFGKLRSGFSYLQLHPFRFACFGGLGLVLFWLVVTKSLPYALAPSFPDMALGLNANNPAALMAKAEKLRDKFLKASGVVETIGARVADTSDADTLAYLPEAKTDSVDESKGERDDLRRQIRRLALRAIANDPLNSEAYRMIAEVTDDPEHVRVLMQAAVERSRHESTALFWLLNDSYHHQDFRAAVAYADLLLRTRLDLSTYVFSYLAFIAEDPGGSPILVQELAKGPLWRASFFEALPRNTKQMDTPLKLMIALKESAKPAVDKELTPYLNALMKRDLTDNAYNSWLQFLPKSELDILGLLRHPNFERDPTGIPFDWQMARGLGARAEFVPVRETERALHVTFGYGRVQFPEVSQIVVLAPGKYRIEGKIRGSIITKRGLRWQLRCTSAPHRVLGETDMLMGQSQQWRIFSLEAEVPQSADCVGQTLRVFHDSRSASEEFITGEVWFTSMHLERLNAASQ